MQVTDKLTKALTEAKYLNADNVSRYRCIMRIFFENYEKLRYWLYQEEVYAQMVQDPFFAEYKLEQCQQDLAMLVEWKNLNTIQDTRKVSSIEEFKNKKFRYHVGGKVLAHFLFQFGNEGLTFFRDNIGHQIR